MTEYATGEIGAFGKIATLAAPGQIARNIATPVFSGDDMLDMKLISLVVFVNLTILASTPRTSAYELPKRFLQH